MHTFDHPVSDPSIEYTVAPSDDGPSLMVRIDSETLLFGTTHPNTQTALDTLHLWTSGRSDAVTVANELMRLSDVGADLNAKLREVSTRFSYADKTLRFDGDVIDKRLTRVILDRLRAGDDNWAAYARFMLALANNPSHQSRKALYRWISDRHLTITAEGYVVGYKGVDNDGYSQHAGRGIIHRQAFDESVETQHIEYGQLPNEVGTWVEFPRAEVDPDPDSHCSVGLHVGSEEFARGFGQRLLTVLVDPAAVVMVPRDAEGQKMRVWQYHVTGIEPRAAMNTHTLEAQVAFTPDEHGWDDDDQFEDDIEAWSESDLSDLDTGFDDEPLTRF